MNKFWQDVRREPAVWIAAVEAVISILVAFNLGVSAHSAALIVTFIGVVGGAITAWGTTNTHLSIVVTIFKAALVLAVGFGAHVSDEQIGILAAALVTIGALFNRTQNSPSGVTTTATYVVPDSGGNP